jgi:hypothetical protein
MRTLVRVTERSAGRARRRRRRQRQRKERRARMRRSRALTHVHQFPSAGHEQGGTSAAAREASVCMRPLTRRHTPARAAPSEGVAPGPPWMQEPNARSRHEKDKSATRNARSRHEKDKSETPNARSRHEKDKSATRNARSRHENHGRARCGTAPHSRRCREEARRRLTAADARRQRPRPSGPAWCACYGRTRQGRQ